MPTMIDATSAIRYDQLPLSPVAWDFGLFQLRWYALSYIAMIALGWWYLRKMLRRSAAPMAERHVDDLVFYLALGIILGGRLGYCLFYRPEILRDPLEVLKLWQGGMSLHGGFLGVIVSLIVFTRRHRLSLLRVCDYVACATPFGLVLVRIANFVNGELWGRPSSLPWAVIFPGTQDGIPRHPSQLYEAALEGGVTMIVLAYLFWRTNARLRPGRLLGTGLILYGTARFLLEFVRQPDAGLDHLWWGLTMGQTLSVPMIVAGIWFWGRSYTRSSVTPVPA
ncbi:MULTISPECIES: prolipoprotein diacylglyceryl transferase [unclassified Sphingomonas]|uniref:prolipoprotein diacylglyceryl transferase n=1 Tax=unclassified Sphingomonas TaxID=196159 RepID=UPI0006FDCCA4|nr:MULTISPECIES: prolipoprotein diacylglyceryl transferase [unclassified Sphingomonas]KQS49452.1 prolipoprotein diacylglyceryl transferase [Sphingomonas sp. Leaf198]